MPDFVVVFGLVIYRYLERIFLYLLGENFCVAKNMINNFRCFIHVILLQSDKCSNTKKIRLFLSNGMKFEASEEWLRIEPRRILNENYLLIYIWMALCVCLLYNMHLLSQIDGIVKRMCEKIRHYQQFPTVDISRKIQFSVLVKYFDTFRIY